MLQSIDERWAGVTANGSDGWESTGTSRLGCVAIAKANPPVKHIPTAPTPGPPQRSCSAPARARNQPTTGDVRCVAQVVNSRLTHRGTTVRAKWAAAVILFPSFVSRPGSPNRWGMTAVHPIPATVRANAATFGVIPGSSAMTITAGPLPRRNTVRSLPSWENVPREKSPRSSSAIAGVSRCAEGQPAEPILSTAAPVTRSAARSARAWSAWSNE